MARWDVECVERQLSGFRALDVVREVLIHLPQMFRYLQLTRRARAIPVDIQTSRGLFLLCVGRIPIIDMFPRRHEWKMSHVMPLWEAFVPWYTTSGFEFQPAS